ncbi:hypothetical protein MCOR25_002516 [Pyricularia grisea]|uniref:Mmc1 C-terminal domain-containing protein n=1 Tax=Pyricularia grisea TaxID=148305 RepID=A0A6P8B0N4_PYRGI|nr:uncharacterized protein PgNI_06829 [Pyricularia grisea]KAI6377534.1 hypothetical protein MCOR25_002516 [Pyricularia grisea]TLD08470.1 hypothetical protein PgNI_06829 [Pyricularia grisea]
MPPRSVPRGILRPTRSLQKVIAAPTSSICFLCSHSLPIGAGRSSSTVTHPKTRLGSRRDESTIAAAPDPNPRQELQGALTALQRHAPNYINISRVELALQGLRQDAGREAVRLAILGLGDNGSAGRAAKGLLRSMLADPLSPEQEWERQLDQRDELRPLIIRIRPEASHSDSDPARPGFVRPANARDSAVLEIPVSSPTLNNHGLEILLATVGSVAPPGQNNNSSVALEEAALAPAIDIPTSSTGRFTQIATPVHKALFVADGVAGASKIGSLSGLGSTDDIAGAVNLKSCADEDLVGCPFTRVDVESARQAVTLFREDVGNAMEFEALWFKSNVPAAKDWLLNGALSNEDGTTKAAVKQLIVSILRNAVTRIEEDEARNLSVALQRSTAVTELNSALAEWSEAAHSELREQLDEAFAGRRWRKLGWWKLFWRVDDVGMLSSEMISQRFLPRAEQGAVYLAGGIDGSGLFGKMGQAPGYQVPAREASSAEAAVAAPAATKWPAHIAETRNYLLQKSVPALQALAQQLLIQTLSTTTLTTSLGVLAYLSSFGAYEAGAIAALGTVFSLRRMQTKWETAREYWHGEVREEGRKAVRAVEASVEGVLEQGRAGGNDAINAEELRRAMDLVNTAEDALEKLR